MHTFLLNFEAVLRGCKKDIDPIDKKVIFLEQVSKSQRLKIDIATFRRMRDDDPAKTFEWLREALLRQVELDKLAANRQAQENAFRSGPAGPGGRPEEEAAQHPSSAACDQNALELARSASTPEARTWS